MKKLFYLLLMLTFPLAVNAQENDTITIHTSAQCGACKMKIEHDMAYVKGVKLAVLNLETKNLIIVYNPEKTNPEKLRLALTKTGYDADSVIADPKAYEELLQCCKKGGHD